MKAKALVLVGILAVLALLSISAASAYPMYPSTCSPTPRIGGWFGQSSTFIIGLRPGAYYTPSYTPTCSRASWYRSSIGWNSYSGYSNNWDYDYGKYTSPRQNC